MNCRRVRSLLAGRPGDAVARRHLAGCAACAEYARRLDGARDGLRRHRTVVLPDAGFAARVTARLERPPDALTWALARLMPVSLTLVLVLTAFCLARTPAPDRLALELPASDILTWVLADAGTTP